MASYSIINVRASERELLLELLFQFREAVFDEDLEIVNESFTVRVRPQVAEKILTEAAKEYPDAIIQTSTTYESTRHEITHIYRYTGEGSYLEEMKANYSLVGYDLDELSYEETTELHNKVRNCFEGVDTFTINEDGSYVTNISGDEMPAIIETTNYTYKITKEALEVSIEDIVEK